jgi:hypothetical protein
MNIQGTEMLRGEGFVLRPITEEDAQRMVAASASDIPDWTFIPRDLGAWPKTLICRKSRPLSICCLVQECLEMPLSGYAPRQTQDRPMRFAAFTATVHRLAQFIRQGCHNARVVSAALVKLPLSVWLSFPPITTD